MCAEELRITRLQGGVGGQRLEILIFGGGGGGGGLCGDFELSGQTLGMLILGGGGGRGSVWRLGEVPGVQGQI